MFVKERMTSNPICIQVSASLSQLAGLMKEKGISKVPVLSGDKLVGIVTDSDVEKFSPSTATSLSVFEINYLLAKATVKDTMVKNVFTCRPETYIEDAASVMRKNKINCLPVVDEKGKVVGIVTQSDLFDAIISMLGGMSGGNRYVIEVDNVPGVLRKIGNASEKLGINITHFAMTGTADKAELLIRTNGSEDFDNLKAALINENFRIISASKAI